MIVLYAFGPLVLALGVLPKPWVIYLYVIAVPVLLWLRYGRRRTWREQWMGTAPAPTHIEVTRIISRFGVNSVFLVILTLVVAPDALLAFPAAYPFRWLAVMVLYPLLMVWPQELFFRSFFLERYQPLLGTGWRLLLVNAVLFGWAHMLYGSMLSVVLSALGGLLFMDTYLRTRSMKYVWLEHALYGDLLFTIGLGEYFYSGWAG